MLYRLGKILIRKNFSIWKILPSWMYQTLSSEGRDYHKSLKITQKYTMDVYFQIIKVGLINYKLKQNLLKGYQKKKNRDRRGNRTRTRRFYRCLFRTKYIKVNVSYNSKAYQNRHIFQKNGDIFWICC